MPPAVVDEDREVAADECPMPRVAAPAASLVEPAGPTDAELGCETPSVASSDEAPRHIIAQAPAAPSASDAAIARLEPPVMHNSSSASDEDGCAVGHHSPDSRAAAIRVLSQPGSLHSLELSQWEAAADWEYELPRADQVPRILEPFGYKAANDVDWKQIPAQDGLDLSGTIVEHKEVGGHTWYIVICRLNLGHERGVSLKWTAPRRLAQLRSGLYEPVKARMCDEYALHFAKTPFARRGGLAGTTQRLAGWISALFALVNIGKVPPFVAAMVIDFFQAGVAWSAGEMSFANRGVVVEGSQAASPSPATSGASPSVGGFGFSANAGAFDEARFQCWSKRLECDGALCTKVARNGDPEKRRLHIRTQDNLLLIRMGRGGAKRVPLDDVVDLKPEVPPDRGEQRARQAGLCRADEPADVLFLFDTDSERDTIGQFLMELLKRCGRIEGDETSAGMAYGDVMDTPPTAGYARVVYPNYTIYEGEFQNQLRHGHGVLTLLDGTKHDGEWTEDERHGPGTEYWVDGTVIKSTYDRGVRSGRVSMRWPDGSEYNGDFTKGHASGEGRLVRVDGTVYEGQFRDDCISGQGCMEWKGGVRYVGEFAKNKRDGYGTIEWPSGWWASYTGHWKESQQHGFGMLVDRTGAEFRGHFREGKLLNW
eukprot:CAMPEP_0176023548 /NCGR_PEP_ID=MMETSP0120_2-20121206/11491_1 /TAXON_ID=160619 /ORGANISM="Kryptoperidinium foliaceum, Strain CCMP 1326" /LENGTH=652 /DNA_ID=CAMNT_0017356715 /DNA_START=21 /DNA_END=1977 /DNA_ORIENTATION=+